VRLELDTPDDTASAELFGTNGKSLGTLLPGGGIILQGAASHQRSPKRQSVQPPADKKGGKNGKVTITQKAELKIGK
jgi:hypothetical protein